jgi:hypothetical protein
MPWRPLSGAFRPRIRSRRTRSISTGCLSRKSQIACSNRSSRTPAVRDRRSSSAALLTAPWFNSANAEMPAARGRPAPNPADDGGRRFGVAANHLSNERHRASHSQAELAAEKRWKCRFCRTILPFATETTERTPNRRNNCGRQCKCGRDRSNRCSHCGGSEFIVFPFRDLS